MAGGVSGVFQQDPFTCLIDNRFCGNLLYHL